MAFTYMDNNLLHHLTLPHTTTVKFLRSHGSFSPCLRQAGQHHPFRTVIKTNFGGFFSVTLVKTSVANPDSKILVEGMNREYDNSRVFYCLSEYPMNMLTQPVATCQLKTNWWGGGVM